MLDNNAFDSIIPLVLDNNALVFPSWGQAPDG
jgi:hypothetical protein